MSSILYIFVFGSLGIATVSIYVMIRTLHDYSLHNYYETEIARLKRELDYYKGDGNLACVWCKKHADWRIIIRNIKKKAVPLNFGVCQEHINEGVKEVLREMELER